MCEVIIFFGGAVIASLLLWVLILLGKLDDAGARGFSMSEIEAALWCCGPEIAEGAIIPDNIGELRQALIAEVRGELLESRHRKRRFF